MSKVLSPEKIEAKKAREQKELAKWQKVQAKPVGPHYFLVLMIVLTIIYIVDEITSNINSAMQPQILFDLFNITSKDVGDPKYAEAINTMAITGVFTGVFMFAAPFYKSLCDIYGRRLFLAINTCLFGVGLLIIMLANNIVVYLLGVIVLGFVTPNDVQVMYIMEVAPKQHRAKLCSITKAIALVSVSLIAVFRNMFYNANDLSWWRMVYVIPVVLAIFVGAMSIFFVKETPVFLSDRISYLETSWEDREAKAAANKQAESEAKGGVINAIKFIFKHKQIRNAAIAALLFSATTVYTSYYSTIMEGGMSTEAVTTAMFVFPFANGIITFISGFISDKLGRKKTCLILGSFAMVTLAAFILCCKAGSPIASGIFYGASIGGLWSMSDTLFLTIPAESVPTEIRASVMGTMSMLLALGMLLGMVFIVVGQNFFDIGWLCLAVCVPFMAIALFLLLTKVAETKDVDLDKVTGLEWD